MRKLALKTAFTCLAFVGIVSLAPRAQATSFSFNLAIGTGSASGTIDTDGTLGFLTAANITNWNIALNPATGNPFTLLGPLSGNNSAFGTTNNILFTTSTGLFADFANFGYALFQNPSVGSGINWLCFAGNGQICGGLDGPVVTMSTNIFSKESIANNILTEPASRVLIAGSSVPEPASLGMMCTGLMGLGLVSARLRRRTRG